MGLTAKTELTKKLEYEIWNATHKQGTFGCFEMTVGWFGDERVDYITYDTKGIWRCFEIKVSKADFHSKAKKTFIGHYNYYVMPKELYDEVKDEIPRHIGIYTENGAIVKNPKKQELQVDEQILKNSMIRSLYRDAEKLYKSNEPLEIEKLKQWINYYKKEMEKYRDKYNKSDQRYYELKYCNIMK